MSVNVKKITGSGLYLLKQEAENRRNPSPVFDLLQGSFLGHGAKALGIDGQPLTEEVFKRLNDGWSPDGQQKLVRNADSPRRCRGWMVSIGPHKSVSNLLMLYRPEEWRDVVRCHQLAARAALRCMDMFCGVGRRDGQGVRDEQSGLVVAMCTHLANDRAEPHLHDHIHVFNLAHHPSDNTFGALKSKNLYALARAIDAVYQKELSTLLRERLGIVTTRDRFATRVVGVPDAVIRATSTRSADIAGFAGPREGRSAKLAEYAAELTRGQKRFPTVAQLHAAWTALADAFQFTPEQVVKRAHKPISPAEAEPVAARAVRSAAERLARESGTFTRWDLLARSLVGTIGRAIPYERVMGQVRRTLERPGVSKLVRLGKEPASERLYTTESHLLLEARFLRLLDQLATTKRRTIRAGLVDRIIAQNLQRGDGRYLSDEQRAAVRMIAEAPRLAVLTGLTGTGKTQALAAVRAIFAAPWIDRRTVKPNRLIGCAATDSAAETLKHDTGIEAVSLGKLVSALTPTPWSQVFHAVRKIKFDSPAHLMAYANAVRQPKLNLDRRTTVIAYDVSLANTKSLYDLTRVVARSGAKLVIVGDPVRGSFAGHARVLDLVTTRYPDRVAKLECIQRQLSRWAAQAVKAVAAGDARWAVAAYRRNGLLTVAADPAKAREAAIQLFAENGGIQEPRSHLLLATTAADVQWLNLLTQEVREAAGVVTGPGVRAFGKSPDEQVRVHTGDRVMFQRGHTFQEGKRSIEERFVASFADPLRRQLAKHLPEWLRTFVEPNGVTRVRRQESGTVIALSPAFRRAVVELDSGKRAVVKLSTFRGLGLGYAANVFQSHGLSAPHVYTLMGGRFTNRQAGYLGLSRASIKSHLIVTAKGVADLMADPERAMDRGVNEASRQMGQEAGPKAANEKRQDRPQDHDRPGQAPTPEPERGTNSDGPLKPAHDADWKPDIEPDSDHEQDHDFDFDR